MSDSIDRRDASPRERALRMGEEWPEHGSPEHRAVPIQHGAFEGASSLQETAYLLTEPDRVLDPPSEQNLRKLIKEVDKLRKTGQTLPHEPLAAESSYVERFLERAQSHYANDDFKASLEVLHDALKLAPGNMRVLALAAEVRKASEQRQTELEECGLADRIAQCKTEAIKLFDEGCYGECVERFKLLSELEPANTDLRHYLEVSREQSEKAQSLQATPPQTEPVEAPEQENSSGTSSVPVAMPSLSPAGPLYVPVEINSLVAPELPTLHSIKRLEPDEQDFKAHSADEQPFATEDSSPECLSVAQSQQFGMNKREEVPQPSQRAADEDPDLPGDPSQDGRKKLKVACLAGVGLVIGAMLGAWLALAPFRHSTVPAEVPAPSATSQSAADAVPSPGASAVTALDDPQARALKAFKQGRLLEANRLCESILETAPENSFALELKQQIRQRYLKMAGQAVANQKWADASMAWHNLLKMYPSDREAARQMNAAKANLKKEEQLALASRMQEERRISELQQQITVAMDSGRHLPPVPGNAFELIQQLQSLSADDGFARAQRDEILRHLAASANRVLQVKDSVRAGALIHQMETYFPEAPELKSLSEALKVEQVRLAEARNSSMQKVEAAMAAGHFVTPASDNVIAYCSELLALEPRNAKALELKKAGVTRALAQAKGWIQEGKYDAARAVYAALLYLPQAEIQTLPSGLEIKAEIEKLTFSAHAVVHDHALGSCTGRLRFNGYQVNYIPSSDSKDGFSAKISEVTQVESGDKIKIHLQGRIYRFQTNGAKDPQENRTRVGEIHRQLSLLMTRK